MDHLGQQGSSCSEGLALTRRVGWNSGGPGALTPLTQPRGCCLHGNKESSSFPEVGICECHSLGNEKENSLMGFICLWFFFQDQAMAATGVWKVKRVRNSGRRGDWYYTLHNKHNNIQGRQTYTKHHKGGLRLLRFKGSRNFIQMKVLRTHKSQEAHD